MKNKCGEECSNAHEERGINMYTCADHFRIGDKDLPLGVDVQILGLLGR